MNQENTSSDDYQREYRECRIGTLKVFGGIQLGLGVLCGILSMAGIVADGINKSKDCNYYIYGNDGSYSYTYCLYSYDHTDALLGFDITCFVLSGWFLLTGCFPFCMNKHRQTTWRCLKITYMVMCIIGAAIIVPTLLFLGVVGSIIRSKYESGLTAVPALIAITSFIEVVIAIVAASICCCCSSFGGSRNTAFVYIGATQPPAGSVLSMPNTQIQSVQTQATGGFMTQPYTVMTQQPGTSQTICNTEQPPPYKT